MCRFGGIPINVVGLKLLFFDVVWAGGRVYEPGSAGRIGLSSYVLDPSDSSF